MTLDLRDIAIIDSLPVHESSREILVVGCGEGRIDTHLRKMGYTVYSTDIDGKNPDLLDFWIANIFQPEAFPVETCETIICSQVLEHLKEYQEAFKNLLALTERRLIVTVPVRNCFYGGGKKPGDHVVFWDDAAVGPFRNINEFKAMAAPYSTSIRKIKSKDRDRAGGTLYLIIVDKGQPL